MLSDKNTSFDLISSIEAVYKQDAGLSRGSKPMPETMRAKTKLLVRGTAKAEAHAIEDLFVPDPLPERAEAAIANAAEPLGGSNGGKSTQEDQHHAGTSGDDRVDRTT